MPSIRYTHSLTGITSKKLHGFFVGWKNKPSPQKHLKLLRGSSCICLALDTSGKVVGFITAITDGVLAAYIPFLEVLPEYQHKKIGTTLVKKMFQRLKNLYMVDLVCDDTMEEFYKKLGLQKLAGMAKRNYKNQKGV